MNVLGRVFLKFMGLRKDVKAEFFVRRRRTYVLNKLLHKYCIQMLILFFYRSLTLQSLHKIKLLYKSEPIKAIKKIQFMFSNFKIYIISINIKTIFCLNH